MYEVWFDKKYDIQEVLTEYWDSLVLTDREKEFLAYRFGLNGQEKHTREAASEHFGISINRVVQLERKILGAFKFRSDSRKLKEFLES